MSILQGIGVVVAVVVIGGGCVYIFRHKAVPLPCPECEGGPVETMVGPDGTYNRCTDCGHEWR